MNLPYPIGIHISVYRDDGKWENYRRWFQRNDLPQLAVAKVTLRHTIDEKGEAEPAYTAKEWEQKAASLQVEFPNCVFVY